jgi:hypothetical protein
MYNTATGNFQCSPIVHATLHPAHNPSIEQLHQGTASLIPISVNFSLSHSRSPLPLGPFPNPPFLDYIVASGAYRINLVLPLPARDTLASGSSCRACAAAFLRPTFTSKFDYAAMLVVKPCHAHPERDSDFTPKSLHNSINGIRNVNCLSFPSFRISRRKCSRHCANWP